MDNTDVNLGHNVIESGSQGLDIDLESQILAQRQSLLNKRFAQLFAQIKCDMDSAEAVE